jgi:hypothetical protein
MMNCKGCGSNYGLMLLKYQVLTEEIMVLGLTILLIIPQTACIGDQGF